MSVLKTSTKNWWTVIRNEVCDYENFKRLFKLKYWSESVQNIIRDDVCHGKYDSIKAVSYTHLDVYKRQVQHHSIYKKT